MYIPFAPRSDIYQIDRNHTYGNDPNYHVSQRALASLVGLVALGLPFLMLFWIWMGACFRDSISHFYYGQFLGSILVASLAFIGTFLFAYRGSHPRENTYAWFAGGGALGVALFPTTGNGCEDGLTLSSRIFVNFERDAAGSPLILKTTEIGDMFQLFAYTDALHQLSAAVLFAFLGWYCFRVFPRTIENLHFVEVSRGGDIAVRRMKPKKIARNTIYYVSGITIFVAVGALAVRGVAARYGNDPVWWNSNNWTFWCEAAALWAFGLSWVVRGRFFGLVLND